MAGHPLIDSYLEQLGQRIEARTDVTDVIDELTDHLAEETSRLNAAGLGRREAAQAALEGFGDIDLLANHLTRGFEHRFAVPSTFTRFGGWLAGATCLAWLVMIAGWWTSLGLETQRGWTESSEVAYAVGAIALWVGMASNTIVVIALRRRLGSVGRAGAVAVVASIMAAIASVFGWLVVLWAPLLAVSVTAIASVWYRSERIPRGPLFVFASSWTIGATALLIDRATAASISAARDMAWLSLGGSIAIISSALIWRWLTREQLSAQLQQPRT